MKNENFQADRRNFIKKSSLIALGTSCLMTLPQSIAASNTTNQDNLNVIIFEY